MDLIPSPVDPAYPRIELPYLVGAPLNLKYDYEGFSDYPARCGWDKEKIRQGDFEGRSPQEIAAFLQSWLYFAMIAEVLRTVDGDYMLPDVEESLRSTSDSGTPVVENARVLEAAAKFHSDTSIIRSVVCGENLIKLDEAGRHRMESKLKQCMTRIDDVLLEVEGYMRCLNRLELEGNPTMQQSLFLSIAVLGDLFASMRDLVFIWGSAYTKETPATQSVNGRTLQRWEHLLGYGVSKQIGSDGTEQRYTWGDTRYLWERMRNQGWCQRDVAYLDSSATTTSHLFISMLTKSGELKEQKLCTDFKCFEYDVKSDYKHSHESSCSQDSKCSLCSFRWDDINAILDAGSLPVATMEMGDNNEPKLCLHSSADISDFVALSHIWSEGLGNPKATAVLSCQLQNIQRMVNLIPRTPEDGEMAFWLDTLFVPLEPLESRRKAMENMAAVYSKATHVLVLDDGLRQVPVDIPFYEALFRIALSGWNNRLWTLQEGVLAHKLWFLFRDGVRSRDSLYEELISFQIGPGSHVRFAFGPLLSDCMNMSLIHTTISREIGSRRVTALSRALRHRSCLRSADECICLATMLGLDLTPLLDLPESDIQKRMAYIWRSQEVLPRQLLTLRSNNLEEPGLQWAPSSLMGLQQGVGDSRITFRQCQDKLVMNCTAFLLKSVVRCSNLPWILVPRTYEKDGVFLQVIGLPDAVYPEAELKNAVLLIPSMANAMPANGGGKIVQGLVANLDNFYLDGNEIIASFLANVMFTGCEFRLQPGEMAPQLPDAIEFDAFIPLEERNAMKFFRDAFGFSDTRHGLALEYLPSYLRFYLHRVVLLLRYLYLVWARMTVWPSENGMVWAEITFATRSRSVFTDGVSQAELHAAFSCMERVSTQIASALGHSTHFLSSATEYIINKLPSLRLSDMVLQFMPASSTLGIQSKWKIELSKLLDPEHDLDGVTDRPDLRNTILQATLAIARRQHINKPTEEPLPEGMRESWEKLLMAFVVQELRVVEDLFPRTQEWHIKYGNESNQEVSHVPEADEANQSAA